MMLDGDTMVTEVSFLILCKLDERSEQACNLKFFDFSFFTTQSLNHESNHDLSRSEAVSTRKIFSKHSQPINQSIPANVFVDSSSPSLLKPKYRIAIYLSILNIRTLYKCMNQQHCTSRPLIHNQQ